MKKKAVEEEIRHNEEEIKRDEEEIARLKEQLRQGEEELAKLEHELSEEDGRSEAFWSKQLPDGSWMIIEGGAVAVGVPEVAAASSGDQTSGVWLPPITVSRPFKSPGCWKLYINGTTGPFHPHEHADNCTESPNLMARGWAHGHFPYELEPQPASLVGRRPRRPDFLWR